MSSLLHVSYIKTSSKHKDTLNTHNQTQEQRQREYQKLKFIYQERFWGGCHLQIIFIWIFTCAWDQCLWQRYRETIWKIIVCDMTIYGMRVIWHHSTTIYECSFMDYHLLFSPFLLLLLCKILAFTLKHWTFSFDNFMFFSTQQWTYKFTKIHWQWQNQRQQRRWDQIIYSEGKGKRKVNTW